jgi:glycosyltransferase involved in cell wall biosynthesis
MKRPLLIHVITRLIVGGAQLSVVGLCEALREHYDVRIVCGPETGPEGSLHTRAQEIAPLTVIPWLRRDVEPHRDLAALVALKRFFSRQRPAVVHTHSSKAGILGRIAAQGLNAKVVHTVHGWGHTPADSGFRQAAFVGVERMVAHRTDVLIAVSVDVREEGLRRRIGTPELYAVIPEFVDYQARGDFHSARRRARRELGLGETDEVVGWVGRFVPQKDPDTLAEALERIVLSRPHTQAVLVGDGPMREQTALRLRRAGLDARVKFMGLREDVRSLYPAFDVLIHPSRWEGQPRVIQEAIAERIPVVASAVAGTRDLIQDGYTGYLTQPGDAAAVAARATSVLDDPSLRAPLSEAVVADVANRFGQDVVLQRHVALYERLLARDFAS